VEKKMAEVECPECKRQFMAWEYDAAYRRMREHLELDHRIATQDYNKIFWTASDLRFLRGCQVSPD
jgi:hypothetical protein